MSIGISLLFFFPVVGFASVGYFLYDRSSPKYHHDVYHMRVNITNCSWAFCITSILVTFVYAIQAIFNKEITDSLVLFVDSNTGNFKCYALLMTIFGDYFPTLLAIVGIYSRITHGWDRIYLLPLTII